MAQDLRKAHIEPKCDELLVRRGRKIPHGNIDCSVPRWWVSIALKALLYALDLDHVTLMRGGLLAVPRPGYAPHQIGDWLAQALLVRDVLSLPGGITILPKLRNPPQYDSALFEVEVVEAFSRSHCDRVLVEPVLSAGSADVGVILKDFGILVECKSTREIDLREHRAFRHRTQDLLSRTHGLPRMPWRIDIEISAPVREVHRAAGVLRARLDEYRGSSAIPVAFHVGSEIRVCLRDRGSPPESELWPRWHEFWLQGGQRLAVEPHYLDGPQLGPPVNVIDPASGAELRGPDVNVYGYVHHRALGRKYSDLISDGIGQTEGESTIIALQCNHPAIARDVALRKMRTAHPQLLAVWANPLRNTQHLAIRDSARDLVLGVVRSAQHGTEMRLTDGA